MNLKEFANRLKGKRSGNLADFGRSLRREHKPGAAKQFAGTLREDTADCLRALSQGRSAEQLLNERRIERTLDRIAEQRALDAWLTRMANQGEQRRGQRQAVREQRLLECAMPGQCGIKADDGEPVIRGLRVLGFDSINNRRYEENAVREALHLYHGCKVNFNHPPLNRASEPRSVFDRIGILESPAMDEEGVSANLRYNPAHPWAPMLRWFAEYMPEAIGLSHNAVGVTRQDGGVTVVERIVAVRSVDLVADPATTTGLK